MTLHQIKVPKENIEIHCGSCCNKCSPYLIFHILKQGHFFMLKIAFLEGSKETYS